MAEPGRAVQWKEDLGVEGYVAAVEKDPGRPAPWDAIEAFAPVLMFRGGGAAGEGFPEGPRTHRFPDGGDPWVQVGKTEYDLESPLGQVEQARLADRAFAGRVFEAAGVDDQEYEEFLESEGMDPRRDWDDPCPVTGAVVRRLAEGRPGVRSMAVDGYLDRLKRVYEEIGVPAERFRFTGTERGPATECLMVLTEDWFEAAFGADRPDSREVAATEVRSCREALQSFVEGEVYRVYIATGAGERVLSHEGLYGLGEVRGYLEHAVEDLRSRRLGEGMRADPLEGPAP